VANGSGVSTLIDILKTLLGRGSEAAMTGESPGAAFLRRSEERCVEREIKNQTVLGLVLGGSLLLVACYKLYLDPTDWPGLFALLEVLGLVLLAVTLVIPQVLAPMEAVLRFVATTIGEWVLSAVLAIVYLAIMTPIGYFIRATKGTAPIYRWPSSGSRDWDGWNPKSVSTVVRDAPDMRGPRTGVVGVISFFVKRGKILLLPAVVLLMAFGLALYFVKTSVLAPFIYTLF
jgi:hypothetical protein